MHYYIFFTSGLGSADVTILTFVNNALGITIDVSLVFLVTFFLSFFSVKLALSLSYCLSLCWAFANIMYSRFFLHYISLSAIGQGDSLFDQLMLRILIDGLRWFDCIFIISIIAFCFFIRIVDNCVSPRAIFLKIFYIHVIQIL